jgi:ADP-ribose pyrophosphatase YjhB (NUDIX family)
MNYRKQLEQVLFGPVYRLAVEARNLIWYVQRPTLIGVRTLVARGDTVLLIRHRGGEYPWALPGGGVDSHERLAEAARREVYEEAGIPVHVEYLLGMYDRFAGQYANYIAVFAATTREDVRELRSLEIAEARFFAFDSLPEGLDAGSRRRIDEYLAGQRGLATIW